MRNNKGITLLSLIVYIILSMMIIATLTVITSNFKENFDELNVQSVQDIELDKINLQLTKEIKEGNTIDKNQTSAQTLTFTNGNVYTYVSEEQAIYQNNNVSIAEHITSCNFVLIGDNVLKVYIGVKDESRIFNFAVKVIEN